MTNAPRPLNDYDMMSAEFQAVCHEFYERVQQEQPIYRMPDSNIYIVTRYDDLKKVSQDFKTFSSKMPLAPPLQGERWKSYAKIIAGKGWQNERALNNIDPPEHRRSRRFLDAILNVHCVEALKPRIQEVVDELIDGFIDRGECEFVSEFAVRFPSTVIAEQIGFQTEKIDTFIRWSLNLAKPTNYVLTEDELRECAEIEVEMQHYLNDMMERRRSDPRDDLLSRLVAENDSGKAGEAALSDGELHTVLRFVILGAFGTVINMLGNALYLLITHPDQMAKLRAHPALIPNFVNEALRIETSVQMLPRIATRDAEIAGTRIPEGSIVMLHFGAANHDPDRFQCPHRFDIDRENAREHITFNTGPHLCPGRLLARQELEIAFSTLLRRLEDIEIAGDIPDPPFIASWRHRMIDRLPIRFRKADV